MRKLLLLFSLLLSLTSIAQYVSYSSTDFGDVEIDANGTLTFTVTNSTANAYDVTATVSVLNRPANNPGMCPPVSTQHMGLSSNAQQTVNTGETATFNVMFNPTSYVTNGTMTINMGPGMNMIMCNVGIIYPQSGIGSYTGQITVVVSSGGNTIATETYSLTGRGVAVTTSLTEATEQNKLIYPNPATNVLNVGEEIEYVVLKNVAGHTVMETANTGVIDIASLPSGFYQAELRSSTGVQKLKVMKQ